MASSIIPKTFFEDDQQLMPVKTDDKKPSVFLTGGILEAIIMNTDVGA
jgi:hypothetical protein